MGINKFGNSCIYIKGLKLKDVKAVIDPKFKDLLDRSVRIRSRRLLTFDIIFPISWKSKSEYDYLWATSAIIKLEIIYSTI